MNNDHIVFSSILLSKRRKRLLTGRLDIPHCTDGPVTALWSMDTWGTEGGLPNGLLVGTRIVGLRKNGKKKESMCSERTNDIFKHKKPMEVSWNEGKAYGLEKTNDIFMHIKRRRWKFLKRGRTTMPTDDKWRIQAYKETELRNLGKKENLML